MLQNKNYLTKERQIIIPILIKYLNDYITLASCYLFGTDKLYPGSGFGFTLIGHGESAANLDKILYALQGAKELEYTVDDSSAGYCL